MKYLLLERYRFQSLYPNGFLICYTLYMNIILLEEYELGHNLARRDERTIHLLKVLHKKKGDVFEAGVIGGLRGTGRIEKINLDGSIFVSLQVSEPPLPRLRVRMAVGFVRPIQIKRLLRDLSNFGVTAIDLVGTDLGEKSYRDTKLLVNGGARAALIEGAIQARDTVIPAFTVYERLETWLQERPWGKDRRAPLLLAMDNVRPEGSFLHLTPAVRPAVIAIGPERGWSERERGLLEQAGFLRMSLGSRALRTETACTAAAALALEKIGEDV
jgi:RsmE family RNA methyltransferase